MPGGNKAALISEVGWRGLKEHSSALIKRGILVDIIIKGGVDKKVLDIITKPAGLAVYVVPRPFFRLYLFFYLLRHKFVGDLKIAVVTKNNTKDWFKQFGIETKLLIETEGGYKLE